MTAKNTSAIPSTGGPHPPTDVIFAGDLTSAHIGTLIRFRQWDENHEIITIVTGELRQIYHTSEDTTIHYGDKAEKEHTFAPDERLILHPNINYSDVPMYLGNDELHDRLELP